MSENLFNLDGWDNVTITQRIESAGINIRINKIKNGKKNIVLDAIGESGDCGDCGDCEVFANLFLFVTAQASVVKGRLTLCR